MAEKSQRQCHSHMKDFLKLSRETSYGLQRHITLRGIGLPLMNFKSQHSFSCVPDIRTDHDLSDDLKLGQTRYAEMWKSSL